MTFFFVSIFVILVFWRPQDWLFPVLYGLPILDAVVGLAVLSLLLEVHDRRLRIPRSVVPLLLLGLLLAAAVSHVPHTYFAGMINAIGQAWKFCFFGILLFLCLDRPSRLRRIAWIFVVMACVMAIHALLQEHRGYGFIGQRPLYVKAWGDRPAHTRSLFFGIFEDPNDLAQILATSIPFGFVLLRKPGIRSFLLGSAISGLLVAAILTTHSRGGFIALAVVLYVLCALWVLPSRYLPVAAWGAVGAALVLFPLSAGFLDASAHDRVVFWGFANWHFKHNLLFGIGYDMFWQVAEDRASHNAFVSCYTELGLFGYWFWFVLIQLGIVGCWRVRMAIQSSDMDQRYVRSFAGMAIAAMCAFVSSSYFLSRAYVYPLFFLFAILNAVPVVAKRVSDEPGADIVNVRRDVVVWGTAGAFMSVVFIYFSILLLNRAFYG